MRGGYWPFSSYICSLFLAPPCIFVKWEYLIVGKEIKLVGAPKNQALFVLIISYFLEKAFDNVYHPK